MKPPCLKIQSVVRMFMVEMNMSQVWLAALSEYSYAYNVFSADVLSCRLWGLNNTTVPRQR